MKRRRATSRNAAKAQQTIKRRAASKAAPNRRLRPSALSKDIEVARLIRERDEALEREKATAEVLRVSRSSPGELGPVFEAMLTNATRLCEANFGSLYIREGGTFRKRTDDLLESLQQQTATSEVLRVVSSSPGDLKPVFEAMLGNAVRICGARFGTLWLCEGNGFRAMALHNAPQAFAEERGRNPVIYPGPGNILGRAVQTKQAVQVADAAAGLC